MPTEEKKFLLFYVPYGQVRIAVIEITAAKIKEGFSNLLTNVRPSLEHSPLTVSEWIDIAVVGDYCSIPHGFCEFIVRKS